MSTKTHEPEKATDTVALVQVIADRSIVAALLIAGVVLSITGDGEHAGMLICGALGALAPLGTRGGTASPAARALPLALGLTAALALSGCGAGALGMHRTIASTASVAVGDLDERADAACEAVIRGCHGVTACVDDNVERCRVAGHAADGFVATLRAYIDAIDVATQVDEGRVLPALLTAWRGIRDMWPSVRAALLAIGLDVGWIPESL